MDGLVKMFGGYPDAFKMGEIQTVKYDPLQNRRLIEPVLNVAKLRHVKNWLSITKATDFITSKYQTERH